MQRRERRIVEKMEREKEVRNREVEGFEMCAPSLHLVFQCAFEPPINLI